MAGHANRSILVGCGAGLFELKPSNGSGWQPKPLGLTGRRVHCVVVDARDPARLYAGTPSGILRSDDRGASWRAINQGLLYRDVWSMAQDPRTGDLYAGTQPASIFKSSDGGESWTDFPGIRKLPETHHWTFPRPPHLAHVKDIKVGPDDSAKVYAAIEEGWLIRTLDGGQTWETLKQGVEFDAHAVTLFPDDPNVVIATSGTGVYKSTNGGDTFKSSGEGLHGGFMGSYMSPAVGHPSRPATLFTGAAEVPPPFWFTRAQGANTGFYRSDDRGESWQRLTGGLPEVITGAPRSVAVDPEDPDTAFIGLSDGSIWATDNGGDSFQLVTKEMQGWITALVVAP
jgi:photosystem II stability/assembly factor-like uncharacterized protein